MRFPYVVANDQFGTLTPRLELILAYQQKSVEVLGLVDSGSTVNGLPYSVGIALDARWNNQPVVPGLTGNLRGVEVHALDTFVFHPQLTPHNPNPVRLVFAWAKSDDILVIFGQMNFFMEFNVCFFRAQSTFEVTLK